MSHIIIYYTIFILSSIIRALYPRVLIPPAYTTAGIFRSASLPPRIGGFRSGVGNGRRVHSVRRNFAAAVVESPSVLQGIPGRDNY